MRWRFCHASVVCLQPQSVHLRRLYSVGSSSQMPLGMECRQNEREAERGMWERGILKYLGKKNELNRSLSNGNIKGSGNDLTIHCKRVPQSHNIYHYATGTQFSTFENANFLFLVSITLTQNFWVLSDGNNIKKSSQTQFFLWVPWNLDDGWWKLSDMTQFPCNPNEPLITSYQVLCSSTNIP